MFFKKKEPPRGHRSDTGVEMESSICTGETLIGFRDQQSGKLEQAVVVRCQEDIDRFYIQNDLINTGRIKWKR